MKAGNNLLSIVNDILDFSSLDSGKIVLHNEWLVLSDNVREIAGMMELMSTRKGIRFNAQYSVGAETEVFTDARSLNQILTNVMSNSTKFTPVGGIVSFRVLDTREALVVEVSDSGVGIAQDKLKTIFDPFEQADSSVRKMFGRSGLDLAITKGLVAESGKFVRETGGVPSTCISMEP